MSAIFASASTDGYGGLPDDARSNPTAADLGSEVLFTNRINGLNEHGMDDELLFSRSQLCRLADVPDDAVVFWLRNDLLRSVDLAERKHRRFTQSEVKIAAFLREVRNNGMNVATMRGVIDRLRDALAFYTSVRPFISNDDMMNLGQPVEGLTPSQRAAVARVPADRVSDMWLAFQFEEQEGTWWIWRDHNGSLIFDISPFEVSSRLPAASVVAFDCERMFTIDWSEAGSK